MQKEKDFWNMIFCSKIERKIIFEKDMNRNKQNEVVDDLVNLNYEEKLIQTYSNFVLSKLQMEMNLYPNDSQEIYLDFLKAIPNDAKNHKKSLRSSIMALDCEMA
jgi:hypothetical protein